MDIIRLSHPFSLNCFAQDPVSMTSKAEKHLEKLMLQVEPGSTRHTILHSAKQFKSSWVELGQLLTQVRQQVLYREWGYSDFGEYCSREIRIRRQTADKLTHAYQYLNEHGNNLLQDNDSSVPLPDFRSLNVLEQIGQEELLPHDQLDDLNRQVFSGEVSHSRLAQQFRDLKREHDSEEIKSYKDLKNAVSAARRFQACLENLPPELIMDIDIKRFIQQAEQTLDTWDAATQ